MRPLMQRQNTDQILEYYYEEEAGPRPPRAEPPSDNRRLHIVELDPDLGRRFDPSRIALVAPAVSTPAIGESKQIGDKVGPPVTVSVDPWSSRGAPPPRPPRLSSPPPKGSPSTSFRSLTAPMQMTRGNSDYSIVAVSDSSTSERATPVDEQPTSHTREGASHSVFTSHSQSTDGLPEPSSTDRTFDNRMPAVDEDDETSSRPRSGTITSRSTNHTSSHSHYTQSSKSHYTQSSKSTYTDDMQDLIATVGSALTDMGLDIADLPPAHVVAPPDDDKPSPRHSVDVRSAGSPRASTSITRGSPRTSLSELARSNRGSPRPSMQELARGTDSPRPSMSDITRVSSDLARGSPRPSMSDLARGSPRPSIAEFPRSRPTSMIERSSLSRASSPEKRRMRDLSPEKPRLVDAVRAREASPEKGSRERERGTGRETSRRDASHEKSSRERDTLHEKSPHEKSRDASHEKGSRERAMSPEGSTRTNGHRFSPDPTSARSRSPDKRSVPTITRSSAEYPGTALSSPRSVHTHMGSVHAGSSHTHTGSHAHPASPRTHTSSPHAHPSSPRTPRTTHASPRSPTSPRGSSMNQPPPEGLKYRQPGAPMPESFHFADVLKLKTSAERAQGYVRKINQLATEDSGLGYWVGYMKGRVRTETSPVVPTSPTPIATTFGPHGPGTRRQQPRHVSGGSTTSEATFAVRPDAYVATNISIRSASPPLGPPPSLPYPSLAKDIGIRTVDSRPGAVKAKVNTVGFFSSIGRKASTRRERDRTVMQQARKPHVLRTGTTGTTYAELPSPSKQVQLSAPPTIPGGPRARGDKGGSSRASVIMIGGRDSFQTMSPSGDGSVSIRVPSSNGHGVVTPNLPPLSPGLGDMGSMYSRDRESLYSGAGGSIGGSTVGGGSALGHGGSAIGHGTGSVVGHSTGGGSVSGHGAGHGGGLDQLADVLPHVDRSVLAGYLDRAGGHEIDAISAYLADEKRMNAAGR